MNRFFVFIIFVLGITTVFSSKFHRNLVVQAFRLRDYKNIVISPLSLQFSLCKLATIAEGKAKEEIMQSLEFKNIKELTQCYSRVSKFMAILIDEDMNMFNKMYIDYGKSLDEKFVVDSGKNFGVDIEKIGFNYPKTAKDFINREISQATLNRVTDIVKDSDITNKTCMLLITGAHLRPTWATRFNPQRTRPKSFYGAARTSNINMMIRDDNVLYYDSGHYKIVITTLGWGVSMCFVMPTAMRGMGGFLIDLASNPDLMKELRRYMRWKLVTLSVPKFKIKTYMDLTDIFNKTGINEILNKNTTLLKNILKDRKSTEEMFVSKIKQKIIMDVDEFGVVRDINDRAPFFELQDHNLKSYSSTEMELALERPFYFSINLEESMVSGGKFDDPFHELFTGVYYGPEIN